MKSVTSVLLLIVFLILNILDAHSTWLVLKPNKYRQERNPLARLVMKKLGVKRGIYLLKLGLLIPFTVFTVLYLRDDEKGFNLVFTITDVVFGFVVYNNYKIYRKELRRRNR